MQLSGFLRDNKISLGDNARFLLEKLGVQDERVIKDLESRIGEPAKMSKSKANTVDPEFAVQAYGADTVRLYILFAGPVEKDFEWTDEGVQGAYRFLRRLWNYFHENYEHIKDLSYSREELAEVQGKAKEVRRKAHQTLKKYLEDMQELSFNTAIASIMELMNTLQEFRPQEKIEYKAVKEAIELILFMLYPITPHTCEELWNKLGYKNLLIRYTFPEPDERALKVEELEIPVQINGKLRSVVKVPVDAEEDTVKSIVLSDEKVRKYLDGKEPKKVIYVKNKLISLVV
ncbi:class I tRNA ligase family protein [Thermocrinis sp.]